MAGSKFWWFRWTENGKRYAISLKTEDETEAILKKRDILADIEKRGSAAYKAVKGQSSEQGQLENIVDRYLDDAKNRTRKPMRPDTAKNVGLVLKKFCRESGADLRTLTTEKMQVWLKDQKRAGKATESLRSYTRDLKAWRAWLIKDKLVRPNQLPDLEMPDHRPIGRRNWIEQSKVDEIIAATDDTDLQFVLHCGFNAGLRRGEIAEARVDWFDLQRGVMHVSSHDAWTTKDLDARTVPLKKQFKEFLGTYLPGKSGYVLAPAATKGKSRYRYDINRRLRTHFTNCKVRCTAHDMRRSFASNLVSKGQSIYLVSKWLGDGVAVVERSYGHVAPSAGNIDC